MDKLKELISKLGSEELAKQICEQLEAYEQRVKVQYDTKFKEKVEQIKKLSLEEVNKEKLAIARKVAIFMESKANAIDESAKRQLALEESEAKLKLKRISALVEDRDPNAINSSKELQAEQAVNTNLQKANKQLKEERDAALRRATNATRIASETLKRNKSLEETLEKAKSSTIAETTKVAAKPAPSAAVVENKKVTPVTKTLSEERVIPSKSQVAKPQTPAISKKPVGDLSIKDIANSISDSI